MKFNRLKENTKKRLFSSRGMTLSETLCAILILLLASGGITGGIQFATKEFNRSMIQSESMILFSTLQAAITEELSYVSDDVGAGDPTTTVDGDGGFAVATYYQIGSTSDDREIITTDNGIVVIKRLADDSTRNLVSKGVYSSGKYDLKADVALYYHPGNKIFRVKLDILHNGTSVVSDHFDVIPLNI